MIRYQPQNLDELELQVNDIILLNEAFNDGWAFGYNERTRKVDFD